MATDTQDRCRGLMVGLGVGNLLGVPQEGWPRYAVEASYPNGIRDIEVEPGEPDDDDLAQAIILADAALEAGSADLDVEEIGRRFWRWAEENGRGIGIQTAEEIGSSLGPFGIEGAVPETVEDACSIPSACAPADLVLDGQDMGYTLKAMQVALWCANQAPDFEEARGWRERLDEIRHDREPLDELADCLGRVGGLAPI